MVKANTIITKLKKKKKNNLWTTEIISCSPATMETNLVQVALSGRWGQHQQEALNQPPPHEVALIGLQIAQACGQHGDLGQDLVAMCVNDVLAQGAEPLFFLDYFSCGSLDVGVAASVVGGIARACEMAGCALLGERAVMSGCQSTSLGEVAVFGVTRLRIFVDVGVHRRDITSVFRTIKSCWNLISSGSNS